VDPLHLRAAATLFPRIAEVLPDLPPLPELPPLEARGRLQQALIGLILGVCRVAPHLWVLEDLQWGDAETLSFLPVVFPHLKATRALFLLTGRSAEMRANPALWDVLQALDRTAALPHYVLPRLGTGAIDRLLQSLLDEREPALTDLLARESEGVPLYLVERLKTWRDEGYLIPNQRGGWRWRGDAPAALASFVGESVIGQRLSLLSSSAEQVLAVAAVIGSEVDFDLLSSVCERTGGPPETIAVDDHFMAATDEVLRLGLLLETDAGYQFSHEQVRRVIYQQLAPSQRRQFHERAARAVEASFPKEYELLAHHFAAAGKRQAAAEYLTQAAKGAREVFAFETALSCYGRALEWLSGPGDRCARYDILHDRAEVLGWLGEREAQGRDLVDLLRLAEVLADDSRRASALNLRSEWHRQQGHYESADQDAQAALEIYRKLGDNESQAALLCQLGWNIVYTAEYPAAASYFQQALPIYQELDDLAGQINSLSGLVAVAQLDGDYYQALLYLKENMSLAEATSNPRRIARALQNLGAVHYDLGDMESAEEHLERALALKETIGDRRSVGITCFYLGVVCSEQDDFEAARSYLDTALEIFHEVQDASWQGDVLAGLGRLSLRRGEPALAQEYLQAAHDRRQELGEPSYAIIDRSFVALAELALGDEAAAWQHSCEAVAELESGLLGVEHPQRIYYNHFRVAAATRHGAAARAAVERAAEIVDERADRIGDAVLRNSYLAGPQVNRAIERAMAELPPRGRLRVHLARSDVPEHRRATPEETVPVIWTVDAGSQDTAIAEQEGRVSLRRFRILRLLAEAEQAGAAPTVADLAGALDVSVRTLCSDLSFLRGSGHTVRTRGGRA
jgi:predicted ATPase